MKKSFQLLLTCAALLTADRAEALPTGVSFTLVSARGRNPADAKHIGTITFELDGESEEACRYWGLWDNKAGTASADCWVDEAKARRAASCAANSQRGVDTMLGRSPGFPCAGFSRSSGAPRDVFLLIALETSTGPAIVGLVQWSASAPYLSPIEGHAVP